MPDFTDADEMMAAVRNKVHGALHSLKPAYEEVGDLFKSNAQERIGHYQEAEGPFSAWAKLADSTKDQRERLGYPRDEPLLREGTLRDAIEISASEEGVKVGVPNREVTTKDSKTVNIGEIAEYLEKGTPDIPPRSFLGGALFHEREKAIILINEAIARRLEE